MPWLVRRIERPNTWREATLDSARIREAFADGAEPISVYQVETDIQEAEVAAALWLRKGASLKNPIHLLRIPVEDIEPANLQLAETCGDSDVHHIDKMHRDLIGDLSKFETLANQIVSRSRAGEDIVRTVAGLGLSQRIADFLESGVVGLPSVEQAKGELKKADERWPRLWR